MSSRNAIAFIAGLGTGYLSQTEKQREIERQTKLDAQNTELHDAKMTEFNDAQKQKKALQAAGATVDSDGNAATFDGSGKPVLYDMPNGANVANSDYRQARSMAAQQGINAQSTDIAPTGNAPLVDTGDGTAPQASVPTAPAFSVPKPVFASNGIVAPDQAAAKTAFDSAANTPDARNQRVAAALYGIGKPAEAMQLEAGVKTAQEADLKLASAKWNSDIGQAMMGGHDGLAALVSKSQAGAMKGVTLKAVPSEDGKMVTYNQVAPDGNMTPTSLTFSNDVNGITQAGYMLDQAITPAQRMTHMTAEAKAAQDKLKSNAEVVHLGAQANKENAWAAALAPGGTKDASGARSGKPIKMDEDDKIRFQAANTDVRDAEKNVMDSMKNLMPGDDPAKNPATVFARARLLNAKRNQFKIHVDLGQITPDQLVTDIMKVAKSPSDVMKSLNELAGSVGVDTADKVAVALQANDQWKGMNPPPKPAARPAVPAASSIPTATQTAAPPASPSPALPASPVEAAGMQLDQARGQLTALLQKPRPGLAAGQSAIAAYAAKVNSAKQAVAQLELAYQALLPKQVAAFIGQK